LELIAETQPQLQPDLLRLSAKVQSLRLIQPVRLRCWHSPSFHNSRRVGGSRSFLHSHGKRVTNPFSVGHRQNVNVAAHIRRCPRNPATLHEKTAKHFLACSYPIQPVFRWRPPPFKTQRSSQRHHITGERYRVSPVLQRHATDRLPISGRSSNYNAQPSPKQILR
jgi:hypothetical protein